MNGIKKLLPNMKKNGEEKFVWNWSWWAFLGNGWYLIYRKAYLEGISYIFLMTMINNDFPSVAFLMGICSGGVLPYFVYRRYKFLKTDIESKIEDENTRIQLLRKFGGGKPMGCMVLCFYDFYYDIIRIIR